LFVSNSSTFRAPPPFSNFTLVFIPLSSINSQSSSPAAVRFIALVIPSGHASDNSDDDDASWKSSNEEVSAFDRAASFAWSFSGTVF
jgi:hypothetical protein